MTQTHLVTAADYADSLITARRAKVVLFVLILFTLLAQLSLFFTIRYGYPHQLEAPANTADQTKTDVLQYVIGILDFAGMILPALLTVTLFIILQVQLVGRLVGTARTTSALIWSVVFFLLLFPWQSVLNNPAITSDPTSLATGMKIPGVLYTWAEFKANATFVSTGKPEVVYLHWARFAGFPVLAILMLIWIQFKSDGGLRQSLGRDLVISETTSAE